MSSVQIGSIPKSEPPHLKMLREWDWIALWLPLIGAAPLLLLHAMNLWSRPHLQFFPLPLCVVAAVAYREAASVNTLAAGNRLRVSMVTLIVGLVMLLAAMVFFSPWLAQTAIVATFFAWSLVRMSDSSWTRVLAISALLASTIPLPMNIDQQIIRFLQAWSTTACGAAVDALRIPNYLQGNVIQVENRTLFVEEACSGVTSLYSLVSLALIFSVLKRRSLISTAILLLLTPLMAINGNVLRLLIITIGFVWWDVDLTHGLAHDAVGVLTFLSSGLALLCSAALVDSLLAPIPKKKSEKSIFRRMFNLLVSWPTQGSVNSSGLSSDGRASTEIGVLGQESRTSSLNVGNVRFLHIIVAVCCLTLIPTTVVAAKNIFRGKASFRGELGEDIAKRFPGEASLPQKIGNEWLRNGYKATLRESGSLVGQHSHTWRYSRGERSIIVSLDFAFQGWHSLEECYRNNGWGISKFEMSESPEQKWGVAQSEMINDFGMRGYLWYSLFDEFGNPYGASNSPTSESKDFLSKTILHAFYGSKNVTTPLTFQVQVFVETGTALSKQEREEIGEIFVVLREQLRNASMDAIGFMQAQ